MQTMATLEAPTFLSDTKDNTDLGGDSNFPDALIMLEQGDGKYLAVNATTPGPDPMTVNLLACFTNEKDAEAFQQTYEMTGTQVDKNFEEAREIAISKPLVHLLALQANGTTVYIHWVR